MSGQAALGTKRLRLVQIAAGLLLVIIVWSVVKRLVTDLPHVADGTLPEDEFDRRYVAQSWLAYLHIGAGVLYLFLAPLQLAYRIRGRHYTFHRRLGRLLAGAGMFSGIFALIFGGLFSFGGLPEASATFVFGGWFVLSLVLAVRAIRRDDIVHHRRWMIRAFAIGIGIGTIRIWLAILQGSGLLDLPSSFGPAFWISFSLHSGSSRQSKPTSRATHAPSPRVSFCSVTWSRVSGEPPWRFLVCVRSLCGWPAAVFGAPRSLGRSSPWSPRCTSRRRLVVPPSFSRVSDVPI